MSPILTTNIILTKKPHYLDHQFYWKKLYSRLLPEDQTKIEANKPFIKGGSSNKMEINFKE
jgi:hypothetical protein